MAAAVPESFVLTRDAQLRQRWFGDAVMSHPAKQSLVQFQHLLDRFASPGGVFLEPFGGSGSAMLAASGQYGGMTVIAVELEDHFRAIQAAAWAHFQETWEMQDIWGCPPGTFLSLAGDSRDLVSVLGAHGIIDLIITSPSYGGSEAVDRRKTQNTTIQHHGGGNTAKSGYSQVARMTEPMTARWGGTHAFGPHSQLSTRQQDYQRDHEIIDLVVTSPPYQDAIAGKVAAALDHARRIHAVGREDFYQNVGAYSQVALTNQYSTRAENIGNQTGKKYLESMRAVWMSCAEVLKSGGILCCITRDCVKKGKRVPVGEQNKALLELAGLRFIEVETWRVPHLSFWRTLQKNKAEAKGQEAIVIDSEEVWIFQKP